VQARDIERKTGKSVVQRLGNLWWLAKMPVGH
jgi:hypothetical protein